MSFEKKCVNFVNHIQEHLNHGDRGLKLYKLSDKPKVVGCAICGKTIDEISKYFIQDCFEKIFPEYKELPEGHRLLELKRMLDG